MSAEFVAYLESVGTNLEEYGNLSSDLKVQTQTNFAQQRGNVM
jgi:hypothetical protein